MIKTLSSRTLPSECYVFKHSTRCPISAAAAAVVRTVDWELPLYWIDVIEQRELSNWVTEAYAVTHESPQLIKITNGVAAKVITHGKIRRENLPL